MKSHASSLSQKIAKLDWSLGVLFLLAAAFFYWKSTGSANTNFEAYALYALSAAGISFLVAWLKPAEMFARALEKKMIRKRGPRKV